MFSAENLALDRPEIGRGYRPYGLIDPIYQRLYIQASPNRRLLEDFRHKFLESANGWVLYTGRERSSKQIRLDNYPERDNEVFSIVKPLRQVEGAQHGVFWCVCIDMLVDKDTNLTRFEIHHSEEDLLNNLIVSEPKVGAPDVQPGLGNDSLLFTDVIAKSVPSELSLAA